MHGRLGRSAPLTIMGQILAIDIGGTKLSAGLVSASGELRGHRQIRTAADDGAERVLERALGLGREVIESETGQDGVAAVGLSTNGLTTEDGVSLAPAVPGWSALRIPGALRDAFPELPTAILNDVKAATLAELRWGGLHGVSDGLYVNLGTGVAAGIVAAGKLQLGAHGAAGEIGYIAPTLASIGRRRPDEALLEERIGGRGVATWASRELGRPVTLAQLMAAREEEPEARLRDQLMDEICFWIANVAIVNDPELVLIGGGIMRARSALTSYLETTIRRIGPFAIPVKPARFGAESSLLGAGAIALELLDGD